jgi:2-iminobutanoate/2-iminopropanoate deaminase
LLLNLDRHPAIWLDQFEDMQVVSTDKAPGAIAPYSQAIKANGMVFTAGQIGMTPDGELVGGGIEKETAQICRNLDAVFTEAGCTKTDVVKVTVFITDFANYGTVNTVYAEVCHLSPIVICP